MSHLDPDQLALMAMGEPVASDADQRHLSSCGVCAAEITELRHAAVVARSTMNEATLAAPPSRVWNRIHEELGLSAAVATDPAASRNLDDETPGGRFFDDLDDDEVAEDDEPEAPAATGAPPAASERSGRSWTRALWALAASLVLVAVVGGGIWWAQAGLAPVSIATAALDAFPDHPDAIGTAEVDEARDGSRTLTVTLEGDADSDEYREVWLIRNDGGALISLGVLDGETGTFPIPEGVDLAEYDLVDISFEPVDGDPAHSGNSIVRGQLSSA